ncbi:MAG: anaerobic carbon-monoxide dehydrogenase catalytic subunit [Candidatus Aquicultorales bacterium]
MGATCSASKCPERTCAGRAADLVPCPVGSKGACCSICAMGPCRLTSNRTGVCGATVDTVAARNFARSIAVGTSAHADHGRSLAETLLAYSEGSLEDVKISDFDALRALASDLGITETPEDEKAIARLVALASLAEFGRQSGRLVLAGTAPERRQAVWSEEKVAPRGIDREVVETMHRTSVGTDQDADHLLDQAVRIALADGWGGSALATRLADVLFGVPAAVRARTGLGVLKTDSVNIVVHGHEPLLSEMLAVAATDPALVEEAKAAGASGISLSGVCCTANEALMRRGIPSIGGVTLQEEALLTGLVDVMAVDVQCVFQSLARLAEETETELVTTSSKARMAGVRLVDLKDEPLARAKEIVRLGIGRFGGKARKPSAETADLVGGFSLGYIKNMLGGRFLASLRPLNDAIVAGYVRGIAAVVGCENPRVKQSDYSLVHELIKNNVLVMQTGCMALDSARRGRMWLEAVENAGPLLKEICRHIGIPPVLHAGSCVDNSRLLSALTEMTAAGGLGEDIDSLPVVGLAPEWMSEKALAIGTFFAASGVPVIFGHRSPVEASKLVAEAMETGWEGRFGGSLTFAAEPKEQLRLALEAIDERRERLGITGFGLSSDERLGDKERKRQLIWWQKRLSYLLS